MKFCLAKEHLDYFSKFGMLEIDSIFTQPQVTEIQLLINKILEQRFRSNIDKGISPRQSNLYELGHDLWRDDEDLKKLLFNKKISELGYELGFPTPFRIGSDQYLPADINFSSIITLDDFSSFQGVIFGYLLCLEPVVIEEESESEPCPFAAKKGNVVLLNFNFPIDFSHLKNNKGAEYLLVTYISEKSIYSLKEQADHVHYLKKFGYAFGDRIKENTHPIIYRK